MRHVKRGIAALAVATVALAAGGCNKGPADSALKAVGQALETARPEIERYTPEALPPLSAALVSATARFDQGHYTDALKAAQLLLSKVEDAAAAAKDKKAELTVAWAEISGSLPKLVQVLTARVGEIAAAKKAPQAVDKVGIETVKSELTAITEAWRSAQDAFEGGDIPRALATARDVEAKAEGLAATVGVDVAAIAPGGADPVM
jgi:hypothetical protein